MIECGSSCVCCGQEKEETSGVGRIINVHYYLVVLLGCATSFRAMPVYYIAALA